jgi:ribose transport system ATP-binding protein
VAGRIAVAGKVLPPADPRGAIAAGIALVPEDRKEQGLILDMAIRDNLSLPGLMRFQRGGFVSDASVDAMATEMTARLSVRTTGIAKAVGELSGGNQQKVALGRWLVLDPRVIILDEPTRGVDVGSKREIYALMESLAARGAAVLAISSDLEEVLRISDRIMVLHEGAVAGTLDRAAATEEAVMRLATGGAFTHESAA